jgi:alpha-L-fucosidase
MGRANRLRRWIRNNAKIPLDEYDTLRSRWQPAAFDADAMARLARRASMRYLVSPRNTTTGCAGPSSGDFSIARRRFARHHAAVADACRRHDVVPCWYHSIMDWHHPDYLPRRDWSRVSAIRRTLAGTLVPPRSGGGVAPQYRDIGVMMV